MVWADLGAQSSRRQADREGGYSAGWGRPSFCNQGHAEGVHPQIGILSGFAMAEDQGKETKGTDWSAEICSPSLVVSLMILRPCLTGFGKQTGSLLPPWGSPDGIQPSLRGSSLLESQRVIII